VDVTLFQSVAHRGAHEVGMAAGVHVLARHEVVRVGDQTCLASLVTLFSISDLPGGRQRTSPAFRGRMARHWTKKTEYVLARCMSKQNSSGKPFSRK